ncbi:MAG: T9SS type A sorting domain-containing protein [Flavobacteriales bacterium]|nr:T9SS type A sorting domain-containing protein [Flavobacteriales bacterium]
MLFHNLGIGIQTQGQSFFNSNAGLQIKCNDFNYPVNFFDLLNVTGSIFDPQGTCDPDGLDGSLPAGNIFSHTCNSFEGDAFANTSSFFKYNHHDDALRTPQANCFSSPEIDTTNCKVDYINKQSACPSNFTISGDPCGFGPGPCGPVIVKLKGKTAELRTAFDSLLDGGNTAGLLATVATQSSGHVKNALMNAAPYVSDTVLLAYLNKPTKGKGHVAPGHVKEVIVANSPVTGTVKAATDNRNLPIGIQNQIDAAQIGTSPRRELEQEIAFFENQLSLKLNSLSRFFLYDSLAVDGVDSVIDILKSQDGIDRELQLTEAYIEAERLTEAKLELDKLDLKGGFANFCKINLIIIDIFEDGASFDTLIADTTLKLTVEGIASDTLEHGYLQARAILSMVFGTRFPEHIEPLPQQQQLKTYGDSEGGNNEEVTNLLTLEDDPTAKEWVKVYPNPADKIVTIDYLFSSDANNVELRVYNVFGTQVFKREIQQQKGTIEHDISSLPQGIYLYTITENGTAVSKENIMIVR